MIKRVVESQPERRHDRPLWLRISINALLFVVGLVFGFLWLPWLEKRRSYGTWESLRQKEQTQDAEDAESLRSLSRDRASPH